MDFKEMVDQAILFSEFDPDLSEKLKWVNSQANQNNISFYKMMFYILHRKNRNVNELLKTDIDF